MKTTGIAASLVPPAPRQAAVRQAAPAALPAAAVLRPLAMPSAGVPGRARETGVAWQPLATAASGGQRQALAAVKEFEAVFLRQLAGVMTRSASPLAAGSEGAAFYQGMIEEQLGRLLAERGGGMGLEKALLARLAGPGKEVADATR